MSATAQPQAFGGPPGPSSAPLPAMNIVQRLTTVNEQTWLSMGTLAELMNDNDRAMKCFENALRHNQYSIPALSHIASLCRAREQFQKAIDHFKIILSFQEANGEIWSALGHCYLMQENLQEAYQAYQQALYHLKNPRDPKLWYGIGILYDRFGSLEHAEEAFSAVVKIDPKFEKANEIYFRLGIIYKQQGKYDLSLQCFKYILRSPPRPLTEYDIWFQTGHVYEQQREYQSAKEAYELVLAENPDHAKVLQQLGWLYHQQTASFANQAMAVQYLTRSLKSDDSDPQSWYLLGRCYMAEQNYNKAYEAYQQAVYRDSRNPTFWCSIGVLYFQINQYRDALDAYSRAIRLNPYISEVWYDLGTLYESCNNQMQDALDAYQRAADLDPNNAHIRQRLELLRKTNGVTATIGNERHNGANPAGGGLPNIPPLDNFNGEPPLQVNQTRNRGEPLPEMNIRDRWPGSGGSTSAIQSPIRVADTLAKPAFTPSQRSSSGGVTASPSSLRVQSPRIPSSPATNDESAADALISLQRKRSLSSEESARKRMSIDQPSMSTD
ncbi:hypothetical protein K450DRAFT_250900 [Umbelopsis ramanniana AG]|uniref:TPR-like protein n=1 Tax=Umbelopsis ramanniana AG TaxID=1314678 RepID=A0AAD5HC85_UMBRA|nr:uncharacterized protein K450DRAFT_250900 [Umbelopsis ramanniana AG]KAI8577619.1 hypothetical protein K450DRAFT_250900 [Umbelopsis ramanniana AG]